MSDLRELRDAMRTLTEEREWGRFHEPRSLILALMGEIGELAELVQWLGDGDPGAVTREPIPSRLGEEMSDVLLYLVRLADVLDVDLYDAAVRKMEMNRTKHPPTPSDAPGQDLTR